MLCPICLNLHGIKNNLNKGGINFKMYNEINEMYGTPVQIYNSGLENKIQGINEIYGLTQKEVKDYSVNIPNSINVQNVESIFKFSTSKPFNCGCDYHND